MANEVKGSKPDFGLLKKWNQGLAAIFFVQAVAIVIASATRMYPVTINFLGIDTLQSQASGKAVLAMGAHHLFDVNLAYVVAAFLLVAAIAHTLAFTKFQPVYENGLKTGENKIRWIEYAIGAGLMLIAIGLLVGVQDFATLLVVFGLMAAACLLGLLFENRGNRLVLVLGCVAGGLAGAVIVFNLLGTLLYGAPSIFSWIIVVVTFLLFAAGGVNLYLQHRKFGNWANNLYGEKKFMALSLITKTALAWLLFADVLHP